MPPQGWNKFVEPVVVTGIVVGPKVLGLVDADLTAQLKLVGGIATGIIALQAGAELNLKAVRPLFRVVRRIAGFAVLGTMVENIAVAEKRQNLLCQDKHQQEQHHKVNMLI